MPEYELSSEAKVIGDRLIRDWHTHLEGRRVDFLFLVEKPKKPKRRPFGEVKVISGLNAWLAGDADDPYPDPFHVVLLRRDLWAKVQDERTREAVVDYYLCRCGVDEKTGQAKKLDPDVSAYQRNVERYGAWHEDLRDLLKASEQLQLNLSGGADAAAKPAPRRRGEVRVTKRNKAAPVSSI